MPTQSLSEDGFVVQNGQTGPFIFYHALTGVLVAGTSSILV